MSTADVKLQAAVMGLGPQFILKLTLNNAGIQPLFQVLAILLFDPNCYTVVPSSNSIAGQSPFDYKQCIVIPALIPGAKHFLEIKLRCIDPQGRSGSVVVVMKHGSGESSFPILSANVKIPVSELEA